MFIEDLITLVINSPRVISPHDYHVFINLQQHSHSSNNLTEKQGNLCIVLLKKYKDKIIQQSGVDITPFLSNPKFKNPFRSINYGKKIKIVDHATYNRVISVEFPYDDQILALLRQKKSELNFATWNKEEKSWFFSLDEVSIKFLSELVATHGFVPDEEFRDYMEQLTNIENNLEKFTPMAVLEGEKIKFINISSYTPQNSSDDFLESIFFAKKIGIGIWDQAIEAKIADLPVDNAVKSLIKNDPGKHFEMALENIPLETLTPVINYMLPILVIVGSGNQLDKLIKNVEFFNSAGIKNDEMSVLFRLPSDTGLNFNNYVRNNNLNSKFSDHTKVVFIGDQIPKTIINKDIDFNGIFNYNYYSVHYKIRNYLTWHHNVINILDKVNQRSLNFAVMQSSN